MSNDSDTNSIYSILGEKLQRFSDGPISEVRSIGTYGPATGRRLLAENPDAISDVTLRTAFFKARRLLGDEHDLTIHLAEEVEERGWRDEVGFQLWARAAAAAAAAVLQRVLQRVRRNRKHPVI